MTGQQRRVVLGISGHRTAHLIEWAAQWWLQPGDAVRVVHAYRTIPYVAVDWQLPVDDDVLVRQATERHLREAVARLRRYRRDVLVTAELTGAPAATALAEAARTAGLVLVGASHGDRSRAVLARLLNRIGCPAVVIGATEPTTPITAVAAILRGNDTDQAVLQAAYSQASRLRCGLLALKPWQPPLDGDLRLAEAVEERILDGCLAGWRERFPDVTVAAGLRAGETLRGLVDHLAGTDLLVLGLPDSDSAQTDALLDVVIPARTHCTMLVPAAGLIPSVGLTQPSAGRDTAARTVQPALATSRVRSANRLV
jgi:nucleotide-binding universal stress UspA family protein